jgi:hypothetical protein
MTAPSGPVDVAKQRILPFATALTRAETTLTNQDGRFSQTPSEAKTPEASAPGFFI